MSKVERNVAEQEVEAWLDFKNVSPRKRKEHEEIIETLVNAVEDGVLSIDSESFEITQKLYIPVENNEGEVTLDSLKYVARAKVFEIHNGLKGIKGSDPQSMILGYASAITKQPKPVLRNLDTSDFGIAQAISIFFM